MKSFGDLSFQEKCQIEAGEVNPYSYSTGYDFRVKTAVAEGIKKRLTTQTENEHGEQNRMGNTAR